MILLLISFSIGASIGLLVWNLARVLSLTPVQDRTFLDKPPVGFTIVWPLLQVLVHYIGDSIRADYLRVTAKRLVHAGQEYSVSPEQFFAGKLIAALAAGIIVFWLLWLLERSSLLLVLTALVGGYYYPELWLKEAITRRTASIVRSLPFYLDVITLAIESGSNLTGGISHAVHKSPEGPLKSEFGRALRDIRAGKGRAEALRDMARRCGCVEVRNVIGSMTQAEQTGASLGPVLRAQSDQLRSNRFLKAEKLAMEAPVKLLGPLVLFIFPTTFLVIALVIVGKAINTKVITWAPLVWAYSWPG